MIQVICYLLRKNKGISSNKNRRGVLTLFLLIMQVTFLLQYNAMLLCLESLKRKTSISQIESCFETKAGYFFSFLAYKRLRSIISLSFSNFSGHLFLMSNSFLLSYIYLEKVLFFLFFPGLFWYFYDSTQVISILKAFVTFLIDRIYCYFFASYPVWRIYIWSTSFKVYFTAFLIQ